MIEAAVPADLSELRASPRGSDVASGFSRICPVRLKARRRVRPRVLIDACLTLENFVAPMREELTRLGIEELRSSNEVDQAIAGTPGTLMTLCREFDDLRLRPLISCELGISARLRNAAKPDRVATACSPGSRCRSDRPGFDRTSPATRLPSSPSIGLFPPTARSVYCMLERHQRSRTAATQAIAADLTTAFDRFCAMTITTRPRHSLLAVLDR